MSQIIQITLSFLALTFYVSSFAATPKSTKSAEMHKINSKISRMLDFRNPQNIKRVTKKLNSAQDRLLFEKYASQKKGKEIKFYPFLDRLVIEESKKSQVIRLVSVKPLIIQVNRQVPLRIDVGDIQKSFKNKGQKKQAAVLDWILFPEAHAFWGNEEEQWAFMYAAVAKSVAEESSAVGDIVEDPKVFSTEVAKFLEKYQISEFNCHTGKQATMNVGATAMYGSSFKDKDGSRLFAGCDGNACVVFPTGKSGDVTMALHSLVMSEENVRLALMDEAKRVTKNFDLKPDDFEANCTISKGVFSDSKICSLTTLDPQGYSQEVMDTLAETNLITDKNESSESFNQNMSELIKGLQNVNNSEMNHYEGFVLKSLTACCLDSACSQAAKEKSLPMTSEKPEVFK